MGATGFTGITGPGGVASHTGATGSMGATGSTGAIGHTGATGITGPGGIASNTGATGHIGTTGSTGITGPAGKASQTGATGSMGATGFTGITGPGGSASQTGATGSMGATGFTGITGAKGSTGYTGSIGHTGFTGITGAKGSIGHRGATGITGPGGIASNTGATGHIGTTGSTGMTGPAGNASHTGATGSIGHTGTTGITGPGGSASQTGATGSVGHTGTTGQTGTTGPGGIASNTGATGIMGHTGSTGITGPAGNATQTGATGSIGSTGTTGPLGFTGPIGHTGYTGPAGDTSLLAVKESPSFSGIPRAPTANINVNTTQVATTAFVHALLSSENTLQSRTSSLDFNPNTEMLTFTQMNESISCYLPLWGWIKPSSMIIQSSVLPSPFLIMAGQQSTIQFQLQGCNTLWTNSSDYLIEKIKCSVNGEESYILTIDKSNISINAINKTIDLHTPTQLTDISREYELYLKSSTGYVASVLSSKIESDQIYIPDFPTTITGITHTKDVTNITLGETQTVATFFSEYLFGLVPSITIQYNSKTYTIPTSDLIQDDTKLTYRFPVVHDGAHTAVIRLSNLSTSATRDYSWGSTTLLDHSSIYTFPSEFGNIGTVNMEIGTAYNEQIILPILDGDNFTSTVTDNVIHEVKWTQGSVSVIIDNANISVSNATDSTQKSLTIAANSITPASYTDNLVISVKFKGPDGTLQNIYIEKEIPMSDIVYVFPNIYSTTRNIPNITIDQTLTCISKFSHTIENITPTITIQYGSGDPKPTLNIQNQDITVSGDTITYSFPVVDDSQHLGSILLTQNDNTAQSRTYSWSSNTDFLNVDNIYTYPSSINVNPISMFVGDLYKIPIVLSVEGGDPFSSTYTGSAIHEVKLTQGSVSVIIDNANISVSNATDSTQKSLTIAAHSITPASYTDNLVISVKFKGPDGSISDGKTIILSEKSNIYEIGSLNNITSDTLPLPYLLKKDDISTIKFHFTGNVIWSNNYIENVNSITYSINGGSQNELSLDGLGIQMSVIDGTISINTTAQTKETIEYNIQLKTRLGESPQELLFQASIASMKIIDFPHINGTTRNIANVLLNETLTCTTSFSNIIEGYSAKVTISWETGTHEILDGSITKNGQDILYSFPITYDGPHTSSIQLSIPNTPILNNYQWTSDILNSENIYTFPTNVQWEQQTLPILKQYKFNQNPMTILFVGGYDVRNNSSNEIEVKWSQDNNATMSTINPSNLTITNTSNSVLLTISTGSIKPTSDTNDLVLTIKVTAPNSTIQSNGMNLTIPHANIQKGYLMPTSKAGVLWGDRRSTYVIDYSILENATDNWFDGEWGSAAEHRIEKSKSLTFSTIPGTAETPQIPYEIIGVVFSFTTPFSTEGFRLRAHGSNDSGITWYSLGTLTGTVDPNNTPGTTQYMTLTNGEWRVAAQGQIIGDVNILPRLLSIEGGSVIENTSFGTYHMVWYFTENVDFYTNYKITIDKSDSNGSRIEQWSVDELWFLDYDTTAVLGWTIPPPVPVPTDQITNFLYSFDFGNAPSTNYTAVNLNQNGTTNTNSATITISGNSRVTRNNLSCVLQEDDPNGIEQLGYFIDLELSNNVIGADGTFRMLYVWCPSMTLAEIGSVPASDGYPDGEYKHSLNLSFLSSVGGSRWATFGTYNKSRRTSQWTENTWSAPYYDLLEGTTSKADFNNSVGEYEKGAVYILDIMRDQTVNTMRTVLHSYKNNIWKSSTFNVGLPTGGFQSAIRQIQTTGRHFGTGHGCKQYTCALYIDPNPYISFNIEYLKNRWQNFAEQS